MAWLPGSRPLALVLSVYHTKDEDPMNDTCSTCGKRPTTFDARQHADGCVRQAANEMRELLADVVLAADGMWGDPGAPLEEGPERDAAFSRVCDAVHAAREYLRDK